MANMIIPIVLIEDDEDDYLLTKDLLSASEFTRFNLTWFQNYSEAIESLDTMQAEVLLVDYRLGQRTGLEFLQEARTKGVTAPVIVLTGSNSHELDLAAMQSGASDYLVKGKIDTTILERTIRYAIERRYSENAIRKLALKSQILAETAAKFNKDLDLNAVLETVCNEVTRALGIAAVSVSFYDSLYETLYFEAGKGLPDNFPEQLESFSAELVQRVLGSGNGVVLMNHSNPMDHRVLEHHFSASNFVSTAFVGLFRNDQLTAIIGVWSEEPHEFDEYETSLLTCFADQASQAITNARLFSDMNTRLEQVQALRHIDVAITGSLDLHITLEIIVRQIQERLRVDAVACHVLNDNTNRLEYMAGYGFKTSGITQTNIGIGDDIAGQAAYEKKRILVPNLYEPMYNFRRVSMVSMEDFVSLMVVPLISKGRTQGVLEIYQRSVLQEPAIEWVGFLETMARQTAIAIDNGLLFSKLKQANLDLTIAYDATIEGWSKVLDLRDKETEGHSQRVTEMTLRLAQLVGMRSEEMINLKRGALLHDIGKMGIPDNILLKPGPLNDTEWAIMRKHPEYAFQWLSQIDFLKTSLDIPYCHHERWDGNGYPRGLKGDQIPLCARIFAIVDVWDALSYDRPYRTAWNQEMVRRHIQQNAGTHFDPSLIEAFIKILDS